MVPLAQCLFLWEEEEEEDTEGDCSVLVVLEVAGLSSLCHEEDVPTMGGGRIPKALSLLS